MGKGSRGERSQGRDRPRTGPRAGPGEEEDIGMIGSSRIGKDGAAASGKPRDHMTSRPCIPGFLGISGRKAYVSLLGPKVPMLGAGPKAGWGPFRHFAC